MFLGFIHRRVRAAQHCFPAAPRRIKLSHASADGKVNRPVLKGYFKRFKGLPDALRCEDCGGSGRVWQQDGKLLASGSRKQILATQHGFHLAHQGLQRAVSRGMPALIIQALEMIDVNDDDAERAAMP